MDITYLGHSSFRLRGKQTSVVTDPFDSDTIGLTFPKHTQADIVTISHEHKDHNASAQIEGSPYILRGPGEYEVKGIGIIGIGVFHDNEKGATRGKNTIYHIVMDGLHIVHLGDLGHVLSSAEVESLGEVDVLFVPVGGVNSVDSEKAVAVVKQVDPVIVIPMHYHTPLLDQKAFGTLQPVSAFLKEMGKEDVVPVSKLTMTKDKLPEELQVVVLQG